jgi:hypothetical protein
MKAMGLESDQEIMQLVGVEPEITDLFAGSLEEPYSLSILSRDQVRQLLEIFFLCSIGIN